MVAARLGKKKLGTSLASRANRQRENSKVTKLQAGLGMRLSYKLAWVRGYRLQAGLGMRLSYKLAWVRGYRLQAGLGMRL